MQQKNQDILLLKSVGNLMGDEMDFTESIQNLKYCLVLWEETSSVRNNIQD